MKPSATISQDGHRLHLQHGPIDLIIGADGNRSRAFRAAAHRFETVLEELVAELPELRCRMFHSMPAPRGQIARLMHEACHPFSDALFVTRMAAVAGSVADTVLDAMIRSCDLQRAFVNNGGDIAFHLTSGRHFKMAMKTHGNRDLGRIEVSYNDPIRGIATSGQPGRSHSFGIAESVTVLAQTAAKADVAATLIANAVDLPGHPAIIRAPADEIDDQTDLGSLPVVISKRHLSLQDCATALAAGRDVANAFVARGLIHGASLHLQDQAELTHASTGFTRKRIAEHA